MGRHSQLPFAANGFRGRLKQEARKVMASRTLSKPEWESYCDRISKGLVGKRAQIEVTSLALGDQIAAKWLPLLGITYDPKDDLLEIALEGFRPSYQQATKHLRRRRPPGPRKHGNRRQRRAATDCQIDGAADANPTPQANVDRTGPTVRLVYFGAPPKCLITPP